MPTPEWHVKNHEGLFFLTIRFILMVGPKYNDETYDLLYRNAYVMAFEKYRNDFIIDILKKYPVKSLMNIQHLGQSVVNSLEYHGFNNYGDLHLRRNSISVIFGIGQGTKNAILKEIDRIIDIHEPDELPAEIVNSLKNDTRRLYQEVTQELNTLNEAAKKDKIKNVIQKLFS